MTEDVFALQLQLFTFKYWFGERGVGESVDQAQQFVVVELVLADAVEDAFEFFVTLFDIFQGIIDQPRDGAQFYITASIVLPENSAYGEHGFFFDGVPAGGLGYPEHVGFAVVV
jgi:hypothetical protein